MKKNNHPTLVIAPTPFFSHRGCHVRILHRLSESEGDVYVLTYPHGSDLPPRYSTVYLKRIIQLFPWYKKTSPGYDAYKFFYDFVLFFYAVYLFIRIKPERVIGFLHTSLPSLVIIKFIQKIQLLKTEVVLDVQDDIIFELSRLACVPRYVVSILRMIECVLLMVPDKFTAQRPGLLSTHSSFRSGGKYFSRVSIKPDIPSPDIAKKIRRISGQTVHFLYTGGFYRSKDLEDIFHFFSSHKKDFDYTPHVALAGSGEADYISTLQHKYNTHFSVMHGLNYFDLPEILSKADIGIEPKRESSEGSAKVLNYLASGMLVLMHRSFFEKNKSWLAPHRDFILFFDSPDILNLSAIKRRLTSL